MKINHHKSNRKKRTVDGPRELVTLESVGNMSLTIFVLFGLGPLYRHSSDFSHSLHGLCAAPAPFPLHSTLSTAGLLRNHH